MEGGEEEGDDQRHRSALLCERERDKGRETERQER